MGKKDAQRTKGNTKAASSARSAQFLGENVGFIGFGTSAETAFVPLHSGSNDTSEDVSPDMKVVLRKMHKKDLTTKLKALQEFKELSSEYGETEMVALLPFWSSVYTKLSLDCDGRVREQAQAGLLSVVTKVGRQLAPHLPHLAGVWYLTQFDPHQPAALASSQAWAAAFPPAKQAGALNFCKAHIVSLIIENLTVATAQTLSDPNTTTPEEMEAKYLRTLSMSMTGLAALMEKASPSPSQLESLLQQQKFWKFSRHRDGNVRQGLFEVITQLCFLQPDLANTHGPSLVPAVLTNLLQTEVGAGTAVWTAALQTVSTVKDVWDLVSLQKAVLPPLFKFISGGGAGLAHQTFPNLMPFLSRIPPAVLTAEDCKVLDRWLESFNTAVTAALETNNKALAAVDLGAVITAYTESIVLVLNMQDVNQEKKVNILEEHLLNNLLIRSFSEDKLSDSSLYDLTARFVLSWESKEQMASLNSLLWASITHHLKSSIPSTGNFKPALKMLSRFYQQKDSSESVKLVVYSVWSVVMEELELSKNSKSKVIDCLQNMGYILQQFDIKHDNKLKRRMFSDSETEELFLENKIFPLLNQKDLVPSACSMIWSVAALIDPDPAVAVLISACKRAENNSEIIRGILETSTDMEITHLWLRHQYIHDFLVRMILDIETVLASKKTLDDTNKVSLVEALIRGGLNLDRAEIQNILTIFQSGLTNKPSHSYLKFVDLFSSLALDEKDQVWSEGAGAEVAFILFTLDDASSSEPLWLKCCQRESPLLLKIQTEIKTCLQREMTQEALQILSAKTEKLLKLRSMATMSGIFPNWKDLKPLSPSYLYKDAVGMKSFFLENPFPVGAETEDKEFSLVRPNFSLFWSKLILCEYFPGVDANLSCETIPDCDRVEMEEDLVMNIAPVIESLCYLTKLMEVQPSNNELAVLKGELEVCVKVIVTRLSRSCYGQIRGKMRELSLREGRLWPEGLVWLVKMVYNTSEWAPNISSLMPGEGTTWTEGDIMTTLKLLILSSELDLETGLVQQTREVITGTLLSLGGTWDLKSDSLLWLLSESLSLGPECDQLDCVLELVKAMSEEREMLLYDQDMTGAGWTEACRVSALARFLSSVVTRTPGRMTDQLWDLACCSLVSWCASIQETKPDLGAPSVTAMVTSSVLHLAGSFGQLMSTCNPDSPIPPKLKQEWEEFFSEGVYSALLPLFVSSASSSCRELSFALLHCPAAQLMSVELPALHLAEDIDMTASLPDNITFLYNHLTPLLTSPCYFTQLAASKLLVTVAQNTKELQEDEEEMKEVPRRLISVVRQGDALLESLLQEFKIGEVAGSIPPGTVSYTVCVGYLLAWRVILALIQTAGDELRPKYTEYLKSEDLLYSLMRHLFRLLPRNASQNTALFSVSPWELSEPTLEIVPQLAGSVWISLCRHLPAVARSWWQNLDKTGKDVVEKVTAAVVTPLLWREETRAISEAQRSDNMSLRVRDSVREVVATYTIDEGSMELIISLPTNHPLGDLSVDTGNRVGVDVGLWRKWMLQLTTFLSYQNGTILEGLNLWKRNVDKRFEGVEECYICFYILHGTNHQLPKLACRTCKKKFHSACLYKWFSTSNNSTCPLLTFQGHHSYIVSIAKLCKENGMFTDVTILCDDGKLLAHKIVLAAVSPFLCHVLDEETSSTGQTTIVMPEVRREIVQQLLDFLYTGIMKLSPSATWELQQLVLLLQIDPQNVGVDTINVGHDPNKARRLSSSVCQTLGIKIAHKADISNQNHKVSPKCSPPSHAKHSPSLITSPKPLKSPSLANGVREIPPAPTAPLRVVGQPVAPLKIVTPPAMKHTSKKSTPEVKSSKIKTDKPSLNPIKINMASNSIIRSKPEQSEFRMAGGFPAREAEVVATATADNVIKITRKRPLSEAINYSDMMDEDPREISKRGRGGKSRGKSVGRGGGGGKGRHQDMDNVVCAICNQFDPHIPSYNRQGNTTEWIGCDCNRWFHKLCTRLKEVDDSFSCKLVHKTCLPSSSIS